MNIVRHHSMGAIWMMSRSRGTLYRRICMFNVVSVARATLPRLLSRRRDIKYNAALLADVSTPSKGCTFIVGDDRVTAIPIN